MTYNEIYQILKGRISPKRFAHIEGVVKAAAALAIHYGAPVEKAKLAALLHDCAKESPVEDMKRKLRQEDALYNDEHFLQFLPLLHGPAGAIMSQKEFGIYDEEILEAIRVHTTGKRNMSLLDKIIFLADYIEETRDFPGVDKLRKKAFKNLNKAMLLGYDQTIEHLLDQKLPIYEGTITGRNDILKTLKNGSHELL